MVGIFSIPLDVWNLIVSWLNSKDDLIRLRSTCHWFRNLLNKWLVLTIPYREMERFVKTCQKLGWISQIEAIKIFRVDSVIFQDFFNNAPPSLEVLDMSWCNRLTNDDLKALKPLKLKKLNLCGCIHISDKGIEHLPSTLVDLNLERCTITDEGLKHLPRSLKKVVLPWTVWLNMLSKKGIKFLLDEYPSCDLMFADNHTAL